MRTRRAVLMSSIVALVLLSGCTSAPEGDGTAGPEIELPVAVPAGLPDPIAFAAAACKQAALLAPVPAERAAQLLPAGYQVFEDEAGVAWVGVSFTNCEAYSQDDRGFATPINLADAGVIIQGPDGSGGVHAYQILSSTDADGLGRGLADLGVPGGHLEATKYGAESLLVAESHTGAAPWPGLGVEMEASSGVAVTPIQPLERITWWRETADGTLRIVYDYEALTGAPAQGKLRVESGSPFEAALEATEVDAGGFLFSHRFEAVAGLVTDAA